MPSVLIVEDEELIRFSFSRALKRGGLFVAYAENGKTALEKVAGGKYDVAVVDLHLGDIDGLDIIRHLKRFSPDTKIIVVTAVCNDTVKDSLLREGADCFYEKPFDTYDIANSIEEHLASLYSGQDPERRHANRKSYGIVIDFSLYIIDASEITTLTFKGEGIDISGTGIGIKTDYPLEPGHLIEFTNGERKSGIVTWCRKVDGHAYRAGIKFMMDNNTPDNQLS
ncbi:MAG: response regulator [Thermodesulfovibrionales bacterium]|jgi:CheY-like chemotaxis protein